MANPADHFELIVCMIVTISNGTVTIITYNNLTTETLMKAHSLYLITK